MEILQDLAKIQDLFAIIIFSHILSYHKISITLGAYHSFVGVLL
jgi:hypothetical protein